MKFLFILLFSFGGTVAFAQEITFSTLNDAVSYKTYKDFTHYAELWDFVFKDSSVIQGNLFYNFTKKLTETDSETKQPKNFTCSWSKTKEGKIIYTIGTNSNDEIKQFIASITGLSFAATETIEYEKGKLAIKYKQAWQIEWELILFGSKVEGNKMGGPYVVQLTYTK